MLYCGGFVSEEDGKEQACHAPRSGFRDRTSVSAHDKQTGVTDERVRLGTLLA